MVNVNVFDVNDPRSAEMMHEAEKQGEAWEHLMGGRRAMMGNAWDPWNQMGISWSIYNDFKNKGYEYHVTVSNVSVIKNGEVIKQWDFIE